jgi:hypothetical protein
MNIINNLQKIIPFLPHIKKGKYDKNIGDEIEYVKIKFKI